MILSTTVPVSYCPVCGYRLDMVSSPAEHRPKEGDLSICLNCATVLQFRSDLTLQQAADIEKLPQKDRLEILRIQSIAEYMKKGNKH